MSWADTVGLKTLDRAMIALRHLRPHPWVEVESKYLRELQIKATKYDRVCELLKDAIDVNAFVEGSDNVPTTS